MRVSIDLYSGQPNPSWDLSETEVGELLRRVEALPAMAAATLPDRLGYRGLRAELLPAPVGADAAAPASRIAALEFGGGVVRVLRQDGTLEHRADHRQAVEIWLLTGAQGQVDEAIRQFALTELGADRP